MANVLPFAAVHPVAEVAGSICAPPYDVVSREEARRKVRGKPNSFLHVSRAEIDLPAEVPPDSERVFEKARQNYRSLRKSGLLVRDDMPGYYVYAQKMGEHRQVGITATPSVDEYDAGVIRRHENTKPDKVEDRSRHIAAVSAQTGPVFLAHENSQDVDAITAEAMGAAPLLDVEAENGVRHTVWRVPENLTDPPRQAFARIPVLYIADGHHRAKSASRVRVQRREKNPGHTGTEPYNFFLAVLFPASQLQILPYNRIVKGLNGRTPAQLLEAIGKVDGCTICPASSPAPSGKGAVHLFLRDRWQCIMFDDAPVAGSDPVEGLDVQRLQTRILAPLLGILDPRTDPRIDFVGGIRGTGELEERVCKGEADVAFSLYPVDIGEVMAIADAGRIMPPKSTWFEPKLADGLLIHEI